MNRTLIRATSAIALVLGAASSAAALEQYYGEIRAYALDFCPAGWAPADGRAFATRDHHFLFALYGCLYTPNPGSGNQNCYNSFQIPDLRGRMLLGEDPTGVRGATYVLGQSGGSVNGRLGLPQLGAHSHQLYASPGSPSTPEAADAALPTVPPRNPPRNAYSTEDPTSDGTLITGSISHDGGVSPVNFLQPYQTVTYCIAVDGAYPTRN